MKPHTFHAPGLPSATAAQIKRILRGWEKSRRKG